MNTTNIILQLDRIVAELPQWSAEISLGLLIPLLIVLGLFPIRYKGLWLCLASLIGLACSAYCVFLQNDVSLSYFKILVILSGVSVILMQAANKNDYSVQYFLEFCVLTLGVCLGCNLLISASGWILFYVSVELISLSSYLLVGFRFNKGSAEAALKYLLFGASASALMLYGISWLYGVSLLQNEANNLNIMTLVALAMVLSGLFFKLSAVPMHWWVADTYDAAPVPVAMLLSVAPKVAALCATIGLVNRFPAIAPWISWLSAVAVVSLLVGNLSALYQQNIRRLMAYSSVAHTGVLLIAVAASVKTETLAFYLFIYLIANVLVFLFIQTVEQEGHLHIKQLAGFGKTKTAESIAVLIAFIALTGLPPTAGFTAKLRVFWEIWQQYQYLHVMWLMYGLLAAVLATAFSLFFYLRVPFVMYFRESNATSKSQDVVFPANIRYTLFALAALLIVFFLWSV